MVETRGKVQYDLQKQVDKLMVIKDIGYRRIESLFQLSLLLEVEPDKKDEFIARCADLPNLRSEYEQNVYEIYSLNKQIDPTYVSEYTSITNFDRLYFKIQITASRIQTQERTRSNPSDSTTKPKLPQLEIFPFDSNLENWPTFRDTFTSLVHSNSDIAKVDKFYYLLKAVSGNAKSIVRSMPISACNYDIVWDTLVKRYENKRALATNLMDKLFKFKPLREESAQGLNSFLETFQENVTALQLLNIQDLSGFVLFYLAMRNLDDQTRRDFNKTVPTGEIPSYKQLITFVENQVRVVEMSEEMRDSSKTQSKSQTKSNAKSNSNQKKTTLASAAVASTSTDGALEDKNNETTKKSHKCLFCQNPHSIYRCTEYNKLSPEQRLNKIKQLKLCENCLRDHALEACPSKIRCTLCKQVHHHTLHIDGKQNNYSNPDVVTLTCSANSTVLLGTAIIHVADCWGQYQPVRCIIDSGAMTGYITQDCVKRLGLTRRKCDFEPVGLGGKPIKEYGQATCSIKPRDQSGPVLKSDAVVVSNIAGNLPTMSLSNTLINEYQNILLADPQFYKPAPVDMLIAADLFPYIFNGQNIQPRLGGLPVAMGSIFGYVIAGQTVINRNTDQGDHEFQRNQDKPSKLCAFSINLDQVMQSFWEVESVPTVRPQNPDDVLAEQLFAKDHQRDESGRYIVQYPFRSQHDLGESRQLAKRRLLNLELKLEREPHLKAEYHKFMHEYEDLGHMNCVGEMQNVESSYIIPHFCILKPSSTSTKLRVVFDASCKTSNNESLNSVVLPCPKLQADLNHLLINFRLKTVCLSADICKMYRQILISETQRKYQHILWRYSREEHIKVYELRTVTYGVASSPYLAIKVLHTLAIDEADNYPNAAAVLTTAFFMDDFLWSVDTVDEAISLQEELMALLQRGGFLLRKWASNCSQVLQRLPEEHRETPVQFDDENNLSIKVLGLQWLPASDSFSFAITPTETVATKRTVLSQIGRQFDPLGFVAPCIFYAKCFMQKLWAQHLDWDERLPADLDEQWQTYIKEIPLLSEFKLDRQATLEHYTYSQLLGFCDASMLGYAAVLYLRTVNKQGQSKVSLLFAKSKVAPCSRTITIPRLELLAAQLLAKSVKYVKSILQDRIQINETILFTDSSIVLAWLHTPSYTLKTFVATRVSSILDIVSNDCWYHVSGASNPADVCSRGVLPSALLQMSEWLNGPDWLSGNRSEWPMKTVDEFKYESVPEMKNPKTVLVTVEKEEMTDLIFKLTEKFSSYTKLINVVARCYQFIRNCRVSKPERRSLLNVSDVRKSHDTVVKSVQNHYFSADISTLAKNGSSNQSIRKLNPFIDSDYFLRVGGRLSQSGLAYAQKHPLLLPKKSNFTKILIDHHHKIHLHVGPRTLQSILSQKYWIVSARSAIRSRTVKCISCFRVQPSVRQPIMGELPKFRSQDVHVFHTVGVDIGGPFLLKESNRRNAKTSKSYLCAFVCCATRAVHLEVLTSLSAECFLACLDRFTARRGLCNTVVSDNGTNFVAAGRQLREVTEFQKANSTDLTNGFTIRGINWKHNPPTGSHFGGIYEALIKSAKLLLKRSAGTLALTFEELGTLFARAEAVLNSRPLCALSNDPNEFDVLTPAHFLIGRNLLAVPDYDLTDIPDNRLNRWQAVQRLSQLFWKRWRQDYLHTLNQRQKWYNDTQPLKIGDLVLINSDAPPLQWCLGRVSKLRPGPDNKVRVVSVRTKNGELTRPVVKLSPLPQEQDNA